MLSIHKKILELVVKRQILSETYLENNGIIIITEYQSALKNSPYSTLYPMDVQRMLFWDITITIRYPE